MSSSPKDGAFPRLSDSVVLFVLRQHLGQTKITNLHPHLALHQNVPRGQVSVDVSLSGEVVHALKYEYNHTEKENGFMDVLMLLHKAVVLFVLLSLPFKRGKQFMKNKNTFKVIQ